MREKQMAMVHRIANEMMKADWRDERETPPDAKIKNYYRMARAAIEAMRDPTEAVAHAGWMQQQSEEAWRVEDVWHAMIDAALAEGP